MKSEMNISETTTCTQKSESLKQLSAIWRMRAFLSLLIVLSGILMASAQAGFNWCLKAGINASTQS